MLQKIKNSKLFSMVKSLEALAHTILLLTLIYTFLEWINKSLELSDCFIASIIIMIPYYGVWQIRNRPISLKSFFILSDCVAYPLMFILFSLILSLGLTSELSSFYKDYAHVYFAFFVAALLVYPIIFKFSYHLEEKFKYFTRYLSSGEIKDDEAYFVLSHYGLTDPWGKTRYYSIIAPIVLIIMSGGFAKGTSTGIFVIFIILILSMPGLMSSIIIRRWHQYRYLGENDIHIVFNRAHVRTYTR